MGGVAPTPPSPPANGMKHVSSSTARRCDTTNGVKVVACEHWTNEQRQDVDNSKFAPFEDYGMATSGSIGLQEHGNRVWLRNL